MPRQLINVLAVSALSFPLLGSGHLVNPNCFNQHSCLHPRWPSTRHHHTALASHPFFSTSPGHDIFFPAQLNAGFHEMFKWALQPHTWSNAFAQPPFQHLLQPISCAPTATNINDQHKAQNPSSSPPRQQQQQSSSTNAAECAATDLEPDTINTVNKPSLQPLAVQRHQEERTKQHVNLNRNASPQPTTKKETPIEVKVGLGHSLFTTYMPGYNAEDISVSIRGRSVQIDAAHECSGSSHICSSRYSRRYAPLPHGVSVKDESSIKATYDRTNGKLLIAVPVTRGTANEPERVTAHKDKNNFDRHSSSTQQMNNTEDDGVTVETVEEDYKYYP